MAAAVADAVLREIPGAVLASLAGGDKRNAIARECTALLAVPAAEVAALQAAVAARAAAYQQEYGLKEPGLAISAAQAAGGAPPSVLGPAAAQRLLDLLLTLPHGVLKMSHAVPGAAGRCTAARAGVCLLSAAVHCTVARAGVCLFSDAVHAECHPTSAALRCCRLQHAPTLSDPPPLAAQAWWRPPPTWHPSSRSTAPATARPCLRCSAPRAAA